MVILIPVESLITKNRHDAWDDGTVNACLPAVIHPLAEYFVIVKQLRNNEVRSCIHLLLQMLDICLSPRCLQVHLGVPCYTNAEEIAISLLNELDQICRVVKAILH
jgi:hypothetical protein